MENNYDNTSITYHSKKSTSPEQRIELTIEAERSSFASYIIEKNDEQFLVINPNQENFEVKIDGPFMNKISHITGFDLISSSEEEFMNKIKLYRLESTFDNYCKSVKKYSVAGLKRRDEIIEQHIISTIKSKRSYKQIFNLAKIKTFDALISKPFTIANLVYNPQNDNKIFISIDVRASIFLAYYTLGIIDPEYDTWEKFMEQFTHDPILINNKKIRSKIFGKLDQKNVHSKLINETILPIWAEIKDFASNNLMAIEGDEIILGPFTDNDSFTEYVEHLIFLTTKNVNNIKIKCYKLHKIIANNNICYIRQFLFPPHEQPDIKCATENNIYEAYQQINIFYKK